MRNSFAILALALIGVSIVDAQYNVNPCYGRRSGRARDLQSCSHYWQCNNGAATRQFCRSNRLFDGESEQCLERGQARCFQCPQNEPFRLLSVPNACPQYLLCFLGTVSLNACPGGLVFDGRTGIRNCNNAPYSGGCYRENHYGSDDPIVDRCPVVTNRPVFIRDRRSCSVFYVCTRTDDIPQRYECDSNLHFNTYLGVCDLPHNANCPNNPPEWPTRPPTAPPNWPPTWPPQTPPTWPTQTPPTRPPYQGVPALQCPLEGGIFVPDRFDCNVFHACLRGGQSRMQRCRTGFHFDTITRECMLPRDARCYSHEHPANKSNVTMPCTDESERKDGDILTAKLAV